MIAVDTNILVYAHRKDGPWYAAAQMRVAELAEGSSPWYIPWPCLHEFLAVVTHPRVFSPPSTIEEGVDQVEAWRESPSLVVLGELEGYWRHLRSTMEGARITGPLVHDAHVAALCLQHGVREIWTADRHFGRFPGIRARNPLTT